MHGTFSNTSTLWSVNDVQEKNPWKDPKEDLQGPEWSFYIKVALETSQTPLTLGGIFKGSFPETSLTVYNVHVST